MIENEVSVDALAGIRRALPRKYRSVRAERDGMTFDSLAERAKYDELRLMEQAGIIHHLRCKPKFELQPSFTDAKGHKHRAIVYTPDFSFDKGGNLYVIEVKGVITEAYSIRKRLFLYRYRTVRFVEEKVC